MGRSIRAFFFLLVCLVALVPFSSGEIIVIIVPDPGDDPVIDINPTYDISGFVMDGGGNAVSGVSVGLSGAVTASATTAGNGFYRFAALAEHGAYTVTPSMNGLSFVPLNFSTSSLCGTIINANFTASLLPPPGPKTLVAAVDIDPNTLNLKSNRQYITAYIELPSGHGPAEITAGSVKITAVNGVTVSPVPALTAKSEKGDYDADGIADLAVKFDYSLVSPLLSAGTLTLRIEGALSGGDTFTGEDTINAIKEGDSETAQETAVTATASSSTERQYSYSLKSHIAADAKIKSVLLWKKGPGNAAQVDPAAPAWHYKAHKDWESVPGRYGALRYANVKNGAGCQWDLTDRVTADWNQGISDVVVKVDGKNGGKPPVLAVVYDTSETATAAEETARDRQQLSPVGKEVAVTPAAAADNTLVFTYEESDVQNVSEKELAVYYWDAVQSLWRQASDSVVNTTERSVTCTAVHSTRYQVMSRAAGVVQQQGEQGSSSNSLGQNYPNPFNPETTIEYSLAKDCHVTLKIFNVAGQLIATVVDAYQSAGKHSVRFDGGAELSRGIYYYQIKAGDYTSTKRMVVLK